MSCDTDTVTNQWRDLVIGATYPLPFTVTDPVTDDPTDVTGWEYEVVIESALDGSDADQLLAKTHIAGSGSNDDPENGVVEIRIESDETAALSAGTVKMKIWRTIPGSTPDKRLIGPYKLKIKTNN